MSFLTYNLFCNFFILVLFTSTCQLAVIVTSYSVPSTTEPYVPLSTECSLPDQQEAFCVPIKNCIALINSSIASRRCGPHNEDTKNPFICCEKYYLNLKPLPAIQHGEDALIGITPQPSLHCGFQTLQNRIYGGDPTNLGEFPWLARILRRDADGEVSFTCTGTLITARTVLTTAHCLVSRTINDFGDLYAVSLGEHAVVCDSKTNECLKHKQTLMITRSIFHPNYKITSKNHDNDIGLIVLNRNVTLTNYVRTICLLERSVNIGTFYIAGWGKTQSGEQSLEKLKASIPTFSWSECAKKYETIGVNLTARQICAGGLEGSDACQGDSGGPLMVHLNHTRWYVAGVVSFGVGCGRKGWPAVYINVPSYINWIQENMK